MERFMTYQEKLAEIRAGIARVGSTDPVAIARRMYRLGMDIAPSEVAKVVSVIENQVVTAPDPKPAPKKKRTKKAPAQAVEEVVDNG